MTRSMIQSMTRSVLAVLAGIVTLIVVSFALEAAADRLSMTLWPQAFPTRSALHHSVPEAVVMFIYGTVSVTAGAAVTAWLAPARPLRHAAALGLVQSGLTVSAMVAMWSHAPAMTWIVTWVTALPAACLGGWLLTRHLSR